MQDTNSLFTLHLVDGCQQELANAFASDEKDLKAATTQGTSRTNIGGSWFLKEAENLRVKDAKVFIEAEKASGFAGRHAHHNSVTSIAWALERCCSD